MLAQVLTDATKQLPFHMFACGYGMKIPAKKFFQEVLEPAWEDLKGELGPDEKLPVWLEWCFEDLERPKSIWAGNHVPSRRQWH